MTTHKLNFGDIELDDSEPTKFMEYSWMRNTYSNIKYWIYHRFVPKHMYWLIRPKTLPIGYYDQDTRILHGAMQCLVDFYEHEYKSNDWDWCELNRHAGNEITEIYQYWVVDRPKLDESDDSLYDTDNEMLHRLIDIRKYMWS